MLMPQSIEVSAMGFRQRISSVFNARKPRPDSRGCFLWTFALCSPMLILMSFGIQRRKLFVVECKRCRRDVPAGVAAFPFQSIVFACHCAANCAGISPLRLSWERLIIWWRSRHERGNIEQALSSLARWSWAA
jgi:hypothetical protein